MRTYSLLLFLYYKRPQLKKNILAGAGWFFSPGTRISPTNKTDRHDITEIFLKVALNTITRTPTLLNNLDYLKTIEIIRHVLCLFLGLWS